MTSIRLQPVKVELDLEEGKVYKTKFQTGELFRIEKIVRRIESTKIIRLEGVFLNHSHIGVCPLDPERLIPDSRIEQKEVLICECCGKDL
jgi:hypothetical protein